MPTHAAAVDSATGRLASAIARVAWNDGDHATALPALSVHRRSSPTKPLHCIYGLGLGVVAQGSKQVLLGNAVIDYAPGQSMLTTIDAPVVAHVTRADARQPFLGLFLSLDPHSITQLAAGMDGVRRPDDRTRRAISVEALDAPLLDALVRLVDLLDEPALLPSLAPLIVQELCIRLLRGPHGAHLQALIAVGSPSQQIARCVAWLKLHFREPLQVDDLAARAHERHHLPPALPCHHRHQPAAVPEAAPAAGGAAADAQRTRRRKPRQPSRWL